MQCLNSILSVYFFIKKNKSFTSLLAPSYVYVCVTHCLWQLCSKYGKLIAQKLSRAFRQKINCETKATMLCMFVQECPVEIRGLCEKSLARLDQQFFHSTSCFPHLPEGSQVKEERPKLPLLLPLVMGIQRDATFEGSERGAISMFSHGYFIFQECPTKCPQDWIAV